MEQEFKGVRRGKPVWMATLAATVLFSSITVIGGTTAGAAAVDPLANFNASKLIPKQIMGRGPNGEVSARISQIKLTAANTAAIKAKKIKVGIIMQTMDIEWSTEQVRGITTQVEALGGSVLSVCDGGWSLEKQIACVDNMITKKPDAIISIPVDDTGMAPSYAKISAAGIKLIFIDNVAKGLKFPSQYQGVVTSDNQGNGAAAAQALALYIPKKGTVGILDFGVDFFVTKERMRGAKAWFAAKRPDIVVKVAEFTDTSKTAEVAANFLTANPDIKGFFTEWEVPAMGIITALRAQNKSMPITVVNVASDIALDMAQGGMIKMVGAQKPFDEGVAEATMAARAIIGLNNPPYLAFAAAPFLKNNLLTAWENVYHTPIPAAIKQACKDSCK
jgi:ribose transport system substrate-binding protein